MLLLSAITPVNILIFQRILFTLICSYFIPFGKFLINKISTDEISIIMIICRCTLL